ncbi:hypothetical protein [Sulfurihydrogenibium sp.]|uniref:hypothetical protein n=1 Tax=Sulfurihydrogenibium sp. TaxID=2053621 RepID=UPI002636A796|nr:hypothetical protein [Sulfurihydrogenibium sp.]
MRNVRNLLAAGILAATATGFYNEVKAEVSTFIGEVKPELEIRPRFDWTSKNATPGATEDATALTTRIRLGAHINKIFNIEGLKAYIELNDVSDFIDDKRTYGDSCPASPECKYPFIADPSITRLTEAKISYTWGKTTLLLGRTRVNLDDQRFISDANWRQTPQTFGVVAIHTKEIPNLDLLMAMIYQRKWWAQDGLISTNATGVNFTNTSSLDWSPSKAPLVFHGTYTFVPALKLTGYAYLITDASNTYGLNAKGDIDAGGIKFNYLAEYATQKDPSNTKYLPTKPKVDGDFWRVYLGASHSSGFGARVGYYEMSEYKIDGGVTKRGFSTPLTTYHGFEGWADVLAAGTANGFYYGLKAWHITLNYKHKQYGNFDLIYYKFDTKKTSPNGSTYGNEIDIQYTKNITQRFSILLKGAFYMADKSIPLNAATGAPSSPSKDVSKYWIQLTYKY